MTAPTSDALASALPAGISFLVPRNRERWNARQIAAFQAERLAESGYVLVHTAPDEATVERVADVAHRHDRTRYQGCGECRRIFVDGTAREHAAHQTREILAALADTSAHTADGATGGGEDG